MTHKEHTKEDHNELSYLGKGPIQQFHNENLGLKRRLD